MTVFTAEHFVIWSLPSMKLGIYVFQTFLVWSWAQRQTTKPGNNVLLPPGFVLSTVQEENNIVDVRQTQIILFVLFVLFAIIGVWQRNEVGTCTWLVGSYYAYNKTKGASCPFVFSGRVVSTCSLLLFVALSTCLMFIVAVIAVMGLFYICFCQRQVIAAVRSCPSLLVLSIRFCFLSFFSW